MSARTVVVSPDVLATHLDGEAVLLHMGTKQYFRLNRTGAHIWKALENGEDTLTIARSLEQSFDVSSDEAQSAVDTMLAEFAANALISEPSADR